MDASIFINDIDVVMDNLRKIMKLLIFCYREILSEIKLTANTCETIIRNHFIVYMQKNRQLFGLDGVIFLSEPQEIKDDFTTGGFVDIVVHNIDNATLANEDKYIAFECKRLDGKSQKNKEYIDNGINRFINGQYAKKMPIAGMIGFIQEFKKSENMTSTVDTLTCKIGGDIAFHFLEKGFDHSYLSKHTRIGSLGNIDLYHLFFDFTYSH